MEKYKKQIFIVAGAAAALLIVWWLFRPAAVTVETAAVSVGDMVVTVDGEGKTRFKDKITVTAPISGKLTRIRLREGDSIPKDYVLTYIDPTPPQPRPPSETEGSPNAHASKVYAPISGRLLRIIEKDDRFVQAGAPILELGNPDKMEVVVDILSSDAAQVTPGAAALIDVANYAEPIKARVRAIEPQAFTKVSSLGVEEQRVNVIINFFDKPLSFGDSFRVDVRIIVWQAKDVLKVPSSALFRNGEEWNVFVVERGRAVQRQIVAGHQSATETEILDGLSDREIVILHPPSALEDGSPVDTD
jgi:multidrug efflux pump subunit AcrA (membrane-fusion protein)